MLTYKSFYVWIYGKRKNEIVVAVIVWIIEFLEQNGTEPHGIYSVLQCLFLIYLFILLVKQLNRRFPRFHYIISQFHSIHFQTHLKFI